ncbi:Xylose isomerase domain protein TIM barrel [Planctopirus limnophila DSM 3776]|uniref:Xylose isomerase domain protein TIM barrel n=1 Tax=Planctopirus limnophila (strain ATCC 43296 / DSM 3776 / IFAM 1008 / Mu 290) TaxID=521674 RepID=D5SPL1_PLAL2|nr:sugar phosphate isomerase/epimerase [Planctopirus limnophila]ADG66241.1 Xylose isomerase domain protein TIM barrel [Planctopirus limnophila DSM 3776]
MKYGMNMLLWTSDVNEEHFPLLEQLKTIGYDGVELPIFDMDVARFEKVGKELSRLELGRTAVTICTDTENPISPDAAIRAAALARLKKAIDCCAAAGVSHLCGPIHSAIGSFSGQGATPDEWNWAKETLSKAADYAQQNKVTLVCEYLNRFECYFLTCAADDARFCREVNHPNLKMMYDTFHANIEEKDLAAAMKGCWDQVVHVHISENDRSTPGEGHVDFDTTFNMLKELKYDGWLMVEAFGLALPAIAAATKIWRRMFPDETYLATNALKFMKQGMA